MYPAAISASSCEAKVFVETKSEGQTSTKQQKRRQAELREMGCRVYADIDTRAKVDEMLRREMETPACTK